jgi:COP9 signalosome complex subunit 5
MGLLIGKPDGDTIVVMDTIPSTVIGAENGVDMEKVLPYMAMMSDSIELKRAERFVGWYHSHPFDVETYSHCHLSSIDVQTQTGWQNSIPTWVAIVVDPLRSLAKQEPEFGAYRVFPPTFSVQQDECPDGTFMSKEMRMQRWGVSAERYYALKISFFMSSLGRRVLDTMSKNSLWIRILASSSIMEPENRQRFSERVKKANDKLQSAANNQALGGRGGGGGFYAPSSAVGKKGGKDDLSQGTLACSELAIEQCKGHCSQMSKDLLFNFLKRINMVDDQKEEKKDESESSAKPKKEETNKSKTGKR